MNQELCKLYDLEGVDIEFISFEGKRVVVTGRLQKEAVKRGSFVD